MIIRTPTIDVNSQIEFPLNSYPIRKNPNRVHRCSRSRPDVAKY
jgi:hypothetical protein